jgi:hypothetical protein
MNDEITDRTIFRKTPFKGLISELAAKEGVTHTVIGKSFWSPKTPTQFAIKKRIIAEMKKRMEDYKSGRKQAEISEKNEKLNLEVQELLGKL